MLNTQAQYRNAIWCFGDSSGIDFTTPSNPVTFSSGMDGRGTCTSIADSSGQLLFYSFTRAGTLNGKWSGQVYNKNHQLMLEGDSIEGEGWYNEMTIIPDPGNSNQYFLFSIHLALPPPNSGIHYSVIDMTQDSGRGAVIQKNIALNNIQSSDGVCAIKHGNGRDWWMITKDFGTNNNTYRVYIITPLGVQFHHTQQIGGQSSTNNSNITFHAISKKILYTTYMGLVEVMDFDRCSGYLVNPLVIESETFGNPFKRYWGSTFSPDGSKIYMTKSDSISYLFQYDLNASNVAASKDTIYIFNNVVGEGGGLRLAPDNKIYLSNVWYDGVNFNYPYPSDSAAYNFINMNLSVINSPDSLGAACDFQPYSFYLGGKRTYWGLPNNPDYDLPADSLGGCDSLTDGVNEYSQNQLSELIISYFQNWETVFINAKDLKGSSCNLTIYDQTGRLVHAQSGKIVSSYFTSQVNMSKFTTGLYIIVLQTEKERLSGKFIKNN